MDVFFLPEILIRYWFEQETALEQPDALTS